MDEATFTGIIDRIHQEGIRVNLVMNPTCEGLEWYKPDDIKSKLDFLGRMHGEHGLESVTIANPLFVEMVHQSLPDLEIVVSVLSEVDSIQSARIFQQLGAKVITPDVDVNRNLSLLREMKKQVNVEYKLMVNDGCLYKCPFRRFHFNYISHKSKELGPIEGDSFFGHCSDVISKDYTQFFKSGWIRPEDLDKYADISRFFKIVGRSRPKSNVIRATRAYMNQSWDGDLLDLMSSSINKFGLDFGAYLDNKSLSRYGFFEKVTSCGQNCAECSYCAELAKKLIRLGVPTRGKLEDLGLHDVADSMERQGRLG
jgi:collagenase-like PrtC family protease